MSLINDALKRANEAQATPPPTAEPAPALRPAEHKPRSSWPLVVLPLLLVFVLGLAGWFLIRGWDAARQLSANRIPVAARENPSEDKPANNVKENKTSSALASLAPAPTRGTVTNAEPATAESPKPPVPAFKLQGIFYHPNRPSALINSKTVFVGDKIGQAKVRAIDRESVTLESEGQTKVLTLP